MALFDAFRYEGKRVLVVGGATGMGAATAELVQDAGAEVVVMDYRGGEDPRREGHPRESGRGGLHRRRGGRVRGAGARTVRLRRGGGRHTGDREDQLRGAPPPHRARAGGRPAAAGVRHRVHLLRGRAGLGVEPRRTEGVPRHPRFRLGIGLGHRARLRRLLPLQAGRLRLRGPAGLPVAQAGHPYQRHLPRTDGHPAGPGQQGDVARLRRRLPRGGGHRGVDTTRAGLPARVPVQRGRGGDLGHHPDQRRRLHQLGHHRVLPPAAAAAGFLLGRM